MIIALLASFLNISTANAIIGGVPVSADEEIAHTTVMLIGQMATGGYSCSGTILNEQWILTAAHCVIGAQQMVVVFARNAPESTWKAMLTSGKLIRHVTSVNHNMDYPTSDAGQMTPHNDIGLVQFTGGLVKGYRPVTLLNPASLPKFVNAKQNTVIAGFGIRTAGGTDSGALYETTIPIDQANAKEIDVGSPEDVACHGDSGGPAFVKVGGKFYQWGVASRSDCKSFSIYTPLKSNFYGHMATP